MIRLRKLEKREKALLAFLAAILVFYLFESVILAPVMKQVSDERKINADYKGKLQDIDRMKSENKVNSKKSAELKGTFDKNVKALPESERNPEITYNLKTLTDKSGVVINSVSFGTPKEYAPKAKDNAQKKQQESAGDSKNNKEKLVMVPVTAVVQGDYGKIVDFVESLEKDARLAEVESVNISAKDKNQISVLQATVNMNYYYSYTGDKIEVKYDITDEKSGKDNLFN